MNVKPLVIRKCRFLRGKQKTKQKNNQPEKEKNRNEKSCICAINRLYRKCKLCVKGRKGASFIQYGATQTMEVVPFLANVSSPLKLQARGQSILMQL